MFSLADRRVTQGFDVVILGAGAAGLMCAIEAARTGKQVAVLERADRIGKKILISGGGRCNFTNLHCTPDNFLSANPHFCQGRAGSLHAARFSRAGRETSDSVRRENSRPTFLRSLRTRYRRHAGGRMPRGRRADLCQRRDRSGGAQLRLQGAHSGVGLFQRGRWWWQPAAFPFRKWVRPPSATSWPLQFGIHRATVPAGAGPASVLRGRTWPTMAILQAFRRRLRLVSARAGSAKPC